MINLTNGTMTVYIVTKKESRVFIALEQFPSRAMEWVDGGFNVEALTFDIHADEEDK